MPSLKKEYDIVGLLDGFRSDGELYGLSIISMEIAIELKIEKIIVVARPGSCKAITRRIGLTCKENLVELVDIRGKDLLKEEKVIFDFTSVNGKRESELLEAINEAEAISFDLFDTLVVRNVLYSTDVIEITEGKLEAAGYDIPSDFCTKRISAEKELSRNGKAPSLYEIYLYFLKDSKLSQLASDTEYGADFDLLIQRAHVTAFLILARQLGKKVYITSDTYYSREQICQILQNNEIKDYDELILSSENCTSKSGNLYEILKETAGTNNLLHIGDDVVSDINNAKEHGIRSFQLYSAFELWDLVGGLGLNESINKLSDRIRVGMFVASFFNNPFQFETDNKHLHVETSESIGYLFCAPMIMDFVKWFGKIVADRNISNIWFGARDGFLIKKIYELMDFGKHSVYYLTSRTASIRAGVETDEDIAYVESMKFFGSSEECLKSRFGLDASTICASDIDDESDGLLKYSMAILKESCIKKTNNIKYINSLLKDESDIAFFDFVAKGTSQLFTQKLVPNHICGLYFLQLEPDYMKDKHMEIISFYNESERKESVIFENYYILETVLTSPAPSINEFDDNGQPVYADESRTASDIECIMKIQNGIIEYVTKYLSLCPEKKWNINKKLDEKLVKLFNNIKIQNDDFHRLTVEDPFFNRMTDIDDIL